MGEMTYINKFGLGLKDNQDGAILVSLMENINVALVAADKPSGQMWKSLLLFDTEDERDAAVDFLQDYGVSGYIGHAGHDWISHPLHASYDSGCNDIILWCA